MTDMDGLGWLLFESWTIWCRVIIHKSAVGLNIVWVWTIAISVTIVGWVMIYYVNFLYILWSGLLGWLAFRR